MEFSQKFWLVSVIEIEHSILEDVLIKISDNRFLKNSPWLIQIHQEKINSPAINNL